jgi:hypothetical protein
MSFLIEMREISPYLLARHPYVSPTGRVILTLDEVHKFFHFTDRYEEYRSSEIFLETTIVPGFLLIVLRRQKDKYSLWGIDTNFRTHTKKKDLLKLLCLHLEGQELAIVKEALELLNLESEYLRSMGFDKPAPAFID